MSCLGRRVHTASILSALINGIHSVFFLCVLRVLTYDGGVRFCVAVRVNISLLLVTKLSGMKVFFYLVTTGRIFYISLSDNSNKKLNSNELNILYRSIITFIINLLSYTLQQQ